MGRLKGKVALITGAAQGIGRATALLFAKEGASVILSDINDADGAAVAQEMSALYLHLDVREEKEWKEAMNAISKRFGKLDILVNNAAITGFGEGVGPQDPENASLESWRAVHATNSEGVFLGCKYAIQTMKKGGGSIVNISSRSGVVGVASAAAYAASKAAVINHTKTVALYCCEKGYEIRCNSIHPAAILTPMWDKMLGIGSEREKRVAQIASEIPMKKMGRPEDVALAVLFLASDESCYMTGSELTIDGGILAGSAASPTTQP